MSTRASQSVVLTISSEACGFLGTMTFAALCPDLLCYKQLGTADTLRGRVVRAFLWLMRWWPVDG